MIAVPVSIAPLPVEYAGRDTDADLLASVDGACVIFEYEGCAHYYPRQQMTGRVVGLRTKRDGVRQVLVTCAEVNVPKWVALADVQFSWDRVRELQNE